MSRVFISGLLCALVSSFSQAQSISPAHAATPDVGYVSPERYTNAFFGFSIPLPKSAPFTGLFLNSSKPGYHPIFGLKADAKGMTAFLVDAQEATGDLDQAAKRCVAGPNSHNVEKVKISGRDFWRSENSQDGAGGTMRVIQLA